MLWMLRVLMQWQSLKVSNIISVLISLKKKFDVGNACNTTHSGQRCCSDEIFYQTAPFDSRNNSSAPPLVAMTSNSLPVVSAPWVIASSSTSTPHETIATVQDSTKPSKKRKQPNPTPTLVTAKAPAVVGPDGRPLKKPPV